MCQTRKFDETKIDKLIKDCSKILDSGIIGAPAYQRLQRPSVVLFWGFSDELFLRLSTEIKGLWSNDDGDIVCRNVNSYEDIDMEEIKELSERNSYIAGFHSQFVFTCLVNETNASEYEKFLTNTDKLKSKIGAADALIMTIYFGSNENDEQTEIFKKNVRKLSEYNENTTVICLGNKTEGGRIIQSNHRYDIAVPLIATVSAASEDPDFKDFIFRSKDKGRVITAASASMSKESRIISMAVLKNMFEKAETTDSVGRQAVLQEFAQNWYEQNIKNELPAENSFDLLPEGSDSFGIREAFVSRYFDEKVSDIVESNRDKLKKDLKKAIKAVFPYNQILKMTNEFNIECSAQGDYTSYKGAVEHADYIFKKQVNEIIGAVAIELRQEAQEYSAGLKELKNLLDRKLTGIDQNKTQYIKYFGSLSIGSSLIAELKTLSGDIIGHFKEVFTKIIEADKDIYKQDLVKDLKGIVDEQVAKTRISDELDAKDETMELNRRTRVNGSTNLQSLFIINNNKDIENAIRGGNQNNEVGFFHIGKGNRIEKITLYEFNAEDIM